MPEVTVPQPAPAASPASPPGRPQAEVQQAQGAPGGYCRRGCGGFGGGRLSALPLSDQAGQRQQRDQTQAVQYGTIQSKVTGSGNAKAKESAAITLTAGRHGAGGLCLPRRHGHRGPAPVHIFSQEAQDQVTQAQTQVDNLNKEMSALLEDANNLTVRAPSPASSSM